MVLVSFACQQIYSYMYKVLNIEIIWCSDIDIYCSHIMKSVKIH